MPDILDDTESILLLCDMGFGVDANSVKMLSHATFLDCYIDPNRLPLAVVAGALADPLCAKRRYSGVSLGQLVTQRWRMGRSEATLLAAITGVSVSPLMDDSGRPYGLLLRKLINRYHLEHFFENAPFDRNHYAIRPKGYGAKDPGAFESAVKCWRRSYRSLDDPSKMLLASIMWLYSGDDHCVWLKGLSRSWPAIDAILVLRTNRMLEDWARLLAMHPAW